MAETETRGRRAGGREARKALRAAPLADDIRPIRPGMESGTYKPLSQMDLDRINEAVFQALETIGFADAIPPCIEACTRVGAIVGDDGRMRFPRAVVEKAIVGAARNITLHGQDPEFDIQVGGRKVHFEPPAPRSIS